MHYFVTLRGFDRLDSRFYFFFWSIEPTRILKGTTSLSLYFFLFSFSAMTDCMRRIPMCDLPRASCNKRAEGDYHCKCKRGYQGSRDNCIGKYYLRVFPQKIRAIMAEIQLLK